MIWFLYSPLPAVIAWLFASYVAWRRGLEITKLAKKNRELADIADKLRLAIENHRDQKADDRCWMDDQELYKVLNDGNLGDNRVGDKAAMMVNCARFIDTRCADGSWQSYAELEQEKYKLEVRLREIIERVQFALIER